MSNKIFAFLEMCSDVAVDDRLGRSETGVRRSLKEAVVHGINKVPH